MNHTLTFQMPTTYMPPYGTPLYWKDEVTGVLGEAIWAYVAHGAEPQNFPAPTAEQLALLVAYLQYEIGAPCWRDSGNGELERLREQAGQMTTVAEIDAWIQGCLQIGIDPL